MIFKNIKYKEMKYQKDRKIEILFEGKYKNYQFYILNLGTHPTAYVEIPKGNILYGKHYDDIDINVHGGLTYSHEFLSMIKENSWFIGWDYAHYGDYSGYFEDTQLKIHNGHKYTTKEIFEDVKVVIEQIIRMEYSKYDIR